MRGVVIPGPIEIDGASIQVSGNAPDPVGHFPHARKVRNLLFLSGIGPRQKGSKEIPGVHLAPDGSVAWHDIEAQCRSVFENVRAILEESGSSWA